MKAEFVRKGLSASTTELDVEGRTRLVRISTGAVDRDNEILRPDGADFTDFLKNPVVLFAHDYQSVPVGKCISLKMDDKGITARTAYNNTPLAKEIFQLAVDGFPLAVSVGFIPVEYVTRGAKDFDAALADCISRGWVMKEDSARCKRIFTRWSLLEYSDVPVPSNPEALQLMVSKGWTGRGDVIPAHLVGRRDTPVAYPTGGKSAADNNNKGRDMGIGKDGRVLSAENLEHLTKAIEHGEACVKRMKAVVASHNGDKPESEPDGDAPERTRRCAGSRPDNSPYATDGEKTISSADLKTAINWAVESLVAGHVKAAGDELLTMMSRATGRHIEL